MNFFPRSNSPVLNFLGSIASLIGLLGIPLSVWLYFASNRSPKLTYYVHPVRTSIVKSMDTKGLQVSFAGKEIKGDISTAQVSIWNAGKQAIKPVDILTPIQIVTAGNTQILTANLGKVGRPVSDTKLDESQLDRGIIGLSWRIFERGDGCVIQMIYSGDINKAVTVTGDIEGQRSISKLENVKRPLSNKEFTTIDYFLVLVVIPILAAIIILQMKVAKNVTSRLQSKNQLTPRRKLQLNALVCTSYTIAILTAINAIFGIYAWLTNISPFGL